MGRRLKEPSAAFADTALKQLRAHRSTERDLVSVVEITDMLQAPALCRSTAMRAELTRLIIRWAWAQGSLVVVTPENSKLRAHYALIGFKDWIGTGKMVYDGDVPAERHD